MTTTEKIINLNFSKGLWISYASPVFHGYAKTLRNLTITPRGTAVARKKLITINNNLGLSSIYPSALVDTYYDATSFVNPISLGTDKPSDFVKLGEGELDTLGSMSYLSTTRTFTLISAGSGASSVSSLNTKVSAGAEPQSCSGAAAYRDRVYFPTTGGIYKLTGWNFLAAPAIVFALVSATPAIGSTVADLNSKLLFFKDRMFLINKSRVYFTDVITVGGYPETWNAATNFFDLPSDSDTYIQNAFIHNNLIYFFTKKGVYTLNAQGLPTNWIVRRISSAIRVARPTHVCYNDGLFYYTNLNSIYMFDGNSVKEISTPINDAISEYFNTIDIFPFENGIIVSVTKLENRAIASLGGFGWAMATTPLGLLDFVGSAMFRYHDSTWSEFQLDYGGAAGGKGVIASCYNIVFNYNFSYPINVVKFYAWNQGTPDTRKTIGYWEYSDNNIQDTNVSWEIEVDTDGGLPYKNKRAKVGFSNFVNTGLFINYATKTDGLALTNLVGFIMSNPIPSDNNWFIKFSLPQFFRRLSIKLQGFTQGTGGADHTIEIIDIGIIAEVENEVTESFRG